jgi:hypothetical protein
MAKKPKPEKKPNLKLKRGAAWVAAIHLRSQIANFSLEDLEKEANRSRQDLLLEAAGALEAFAMGGAKISEVKA